MKDLGTTKRILGIEIKRDKRRKLLLLSKEVYFKRVIGRFNMSNAKLVILYDEQHPLCNCFWILYVRNCVYSFRHYLCSKFRQ